MITCLCDYSTFIWYKHAFVVVQDTDAAAAEADKNDKEIIFENHVPFTDCINEINNTQADNSKGLDVVILMYNLR